VIIQLLTKKHQYRLLIWQRRPRQVN